MKDFKLHRNAGVGRHKLKDLVTGLEHSPSLDRLFGGHAAALAALDRVHIELVDDWGYMWVDNDDGTLYVSNPYWLEGPEMHLYLDLCHEVVHVKQHWDGRDLFDHKYKYVARPTEIEAYEVTVAEARRLGMSEEDLVRFLYVEWIDNDDHLELCRTLGVKIAG
ncbi:MAG TPA: hypothetical protein VNZ52_02335 [Candidatus Thermoplasmatota archaeon]|nr:hypothetical protein [Candidatus Thermoplasmatota archaeon]